MSHRSEPATVFRPETTVVARLTLATQLQLERDLHDLPALAELLDRHYQALLAKGDRNPDDSAVRYVTRFDVLDLADRRTKWERCATRTEPLTLADRDAAGPSVDPIFWAELARDMGARRQGILPTLCAWVSLAVGEMHDAGEWHLAPADPDRTVWVAYPNGTLIRTKPGATVASEAGWLATHLEWIVTRLWSEQLAAEVADIVRCLDAIGINLDPAHEHACLNADQIAEALPISRRTVYLWHELGLLSDMGKVDRKRVFAVHEVKALIERNTPGLR